MIKNILSLLIVLVLVSCYSENEEELFPQSTAIVPDTIKFSVDIRPIISQSCAISGCHVGGPNNGAPGNFDLHSELDIVVKNGKFKNRVIDMGQNRMPLGRSPLPESQLSILSKWIEQGALNN